jgi:hypothetical protein
MYLTGAALLSGAFVWAALMLFFAATPNKKQNFTNKCRFAAHL